MKRRTCVLAALLCCISATGLSQAKKKSRANNEQSSFSAEDESVNHPVPIPASVLAILAKDERVANLMENEEPPLQKLPASWFSCAEVHLKDSQETDLVVVGEPPVTGANITPFWIFRGTPQGYELVLANGGHDLVILHKRWNGYREVEILAATSSLYFSSIYRFDGSKYVAFKENTHEIGKSN